MATKKLLFISYASENFNKVKLIKKELAKNQYFEPHIVADKRRPNRSLVKLVKEGIESSYRVIPIFSPQSIGTQWINQEIGYAEGKNISIVPIVENSVLSQLRGFVHMQNQCPYIYTIDAVKKGKESKEFMYQFRLLISDLEEELNYKEPRNFLVEQKNQTVKSEKIPPAQPQLFTVRTGEPCPRTGTWSPVGYPHIQFKFNKGILMPEFGKKRVDWRFKGSEPNISITVH